MTHTRKRAAAQLTLLLLGQAFLSAGITLRAEGTATKQPAAIVWKIESAAVIGGQTPQVIGAPKIIDASVGERALQFNGRSDGLIMPVNPIAGWSSFTIEVLFQPDANGPRAQRFLHIADRLGSRALIETRTTDGKSWILDAYLARPTKKGRTLRNRTKRHPTGKWAWVALVYDGNKMTDYVNGVREFEGRTIFPPMADGVISIGMRLNKVFWFKGCIKEIRFTPAALVPAALQHVPDK